MSAREFQVGDQVSFGGVLGEVVSTDINNSLVYPIKVNFNDHTRRIFTRIGCLYDHHTVPLLILVKPAKKKIKVYVNLYHCPNACPNVKIGGTYSTKEKAEGCGKDMTHYIETQEITVEI